MPSSIPFRRLFRWGVHIVQGALFSFVAATALGIAAQLAQQLKAQVLGFVVERLHAVAEPAAVAAGRVANEAHRASLLIPIPDDANAALLELCALTVLGIALVLAERLVTNWSDLAMLSRLQREMHDRLLVLGPSYHSKHPVAETTAVLTQFASGAQLVLRDLIAFPVIRGVALVSALWLLYVNMSALDSTPTAFRVVLLLAAISMPLLSVRIARRLRAAFAAVRKSELAVAEEWQNSFSQPLEVQLMGANVQRSRAIAERLRTHYSHRFSASARNELATQFQSAVPLFIQLGFLAYGVVYAVRKADAAAGGAVIAVYGLVPLAIQPLQQLVQFYNGLNTSWPQVEKVVDILEATPDVLERQDAVAFPIGQVNVSFEQVTFRYRSELKPVLDRLSLHFEPGEITALVGISGSGKSTIFNLIGRLQDPESGRIAVAGVELKAIRLAELRRNVVRVAQFPLFISDTVRENFLLAKADATDDEIERVCRATGLWDMLLRASGGTPLDYQLPRDVSQGLSGGQRRLLAISRALLHNPAVLLLDEPSTGIDNLTLNTLTSFLKSSKAKMTVIIIDHDLSGFVAKVADRICALENGRLVSSGTHAELMAQDGLYKRLVEAGGESPPSAGEAAAPIHAGQNQKLEALP